MSKYIPRSAVQRTVMNQVRARLYLEKSLRKQINELKTKLRDFPSVVEDLINLGLTRKHAVGLNRRLNEVLIIEDRLKGNPEPVIAPINDASVELNPESPIQPGDAVTVSQNGTEAIGVVTTVEPIREGV